jgi:dGTPase
MINRVVTDLIENTQAAIARAQPESIEDIRSQPGPLVSFTEAVSVEHRELKRFLNDNMYRHPTVKSMQDKAREMVRVLFDQYMSNPLQMPNEFSSRAGQGDASVKARVVADYIAGMTDRFAIAEYERLC